MTGDELQKARAELGLSQLRLAVLVGVSLREIAEFEAGNAPLSRGLERPLQRAIEAAMKRRLVDEQPGDLGP
jgi:transcriptional regulator with XRE-family HTH domain